MAEETIYKDDQVQVTKTRLVVGSTTYAMSTISSATTWVKAPRSGLAIMLALIFGWFGSCNGLAAVNTKESGSSGTYAVLSLLLVAGLVAYAFLSKSDYFLSVSTNSGKVDAFQSKDPKRIAAISAAITEAIIQRS